MDPVMDSGKSTTVRSLPLAFRAVGLGLRTLDRLAPARAAKVATTLFCRPPKHTRPKREEAWLGGATPFRVRQGRSQVQAWRWGQGERIVFLMHGWAGRGAQLGAMVQPLLDQGLSVVTWDALGHGESEGRSSSLVEFADAAFAVARELRQQPYGIIGHSMGASAASLAVAEELPTGRLALISPPASLLHFVDEYSRSMDFRPEMRERVIGRMNQTFKVNMADFDVENIGFDSFEGGDHVLVIHDTEDREVSIEHGERVAKALGARRLHRTSKLGHRRILLADEVVQAAVEWIAHGKGRTADAQGHLGSAIMQPDPVGDPVGTC